MRWRVLASIIGGGTAAVVLSRSSDKSIQPAAALSAVPHGGGGDRGVPVERAAAGPGIRILRIETEPSGALVADQGVQVCMATPLRDLLARRGRKVEHKLTLNKRGFKTTMLTVAPGDEKVVGKLDVWAQSDIAAMGGPAQASAAAGRGRGHRQGGAHADRRGRHRRSGGAATSERDRGGGGVHVTACDAHRDGRSGADRADAPRRGHDAPGACLGGRSRCIRARRSRRRSRAPWCQVRDHGVGLGVGLPHRQGAAVHGWAGARGARRLAYTPAMYQGKAVAVDYAITIKIVPPP